MGIKTYNVQDLTEIYSRTGCDGYQAKYYADNHKHFVKTQATITGVIMNDWMVEIIASKLCKILNINSVEQHHCRVKYDNITLEAVVSNNFEITGNQFISFETLINKFDGSTTNESAFIKMDTISKMEYCAAMISKVTKINIKYTLKYMLDLAVIDILVGNIDRHTRNFGVLWNCDYNRYTVAKIFDSGMGMFENDYYRDRYTSFESKMRNTYIAPYGEDPFDMIDMLRTKWNLNSIYDFSKIKVSDYTFPSDDAKTYFKEALNKLKKA